MQSKSLPCCASPQALNNKTVGYESDLWALGCVIYQMLHGTPPFRAGSEYLIFQKVAAGDYSMQDSFPEAAKDLIRSLLLLDPASRLGEQFPGEWGQEWQALAVPKEVCVSVLTLCNCMILGVLSFNFLKQVSHLQVLVLADYRSSRAIRFLKVR